MATALTSTPLAPLLDRLFEKAKAATSPAMAGLSREERERLVRSKTGYLEYRVQNLVRYLDPASRCGPSGQGGGCLITTEFEPSKVARARDHRKEVRVIDLVEIREADALQTLSFDLPERIDLVLLDGHKAL